MSGFARVSIVGSGQVGTMIGQALVGAGPSRGVELVSTFDRDQEVAARSVALGGAHRALASMEEALQAEAVVLAVPVSAVLILIEEWGRRLRPGCLLLDTGSAKAQVAAAMRARIAPEVAAIGGHPICGGEVAGPEGARPDALRAATFVLTPVRSDQVALTLSRQFVELLGASPVVLDPLTHDRILARTSHLPHLVASALASVASRVGEPELLPALVGPGLRSSTRLAAADSEMVSSFLVANSEEVGLALQELSRELARLGDALRSGASGLAEELRRGAEARRLLLGPSA